MKQAMTPSLFLCLLLAALLATPCHAEVEGDELPSQLFIKGSRLLEQMKADSALACFSAAAAQYSPYLPQKEREACAKSAINTGYVYLFCRTNAQQAYPWIARGMDICQREGFKRYLPAAIDYMAQIRWTYGDPAGALKLYREAFNMATKEKEWWAVLMTYSDLLTSAWQQEQFGDTEKDIAKFESMDIPDRPIVELCHDLSHAVRAMHACLWNDAAQWIEKALADNNALSGYEHGSAQILMLLADARARGGHMAEARRALGQSEALVAEFGFADLASPLYDQISQLMARGGHTDSAQIYRVRAMEVRDSVFSAASLGVVKDLELNTVVGKLDGDMRVLAAQRDAERQRTWGVGVAAAIFLAMLAWIWVKHRKLQSVYRNLYLKNMEAVKAPRPSEHKTNSELLRRAQQFIEEQPEALDSEFSIERLAKLLGTLPRYLSQAISDSEEETDFRTMVAKRRVAEACRRLTAEASNQQFTVEAIAQSVGYKSRSHFSKVFKDITGLTPTQYLVQARQYPFKARK